ncbi:MAG TPA: urease accessory protein UreD [candidate division Zixibacteria bacterium]|nr:urease accessory protein UreD [candidate division Zixibacteria bacterium]
MNNDILSVLTATPSFFTEYEEEKTRLPVGSAGKNAISRLTFERFGEKTHLTDVFNQQPAKIMRELYYDPYQPGLPYILYVNPTGGIVQGDRYSYEYHLKNDAEAFITDTMATKLYKMDLNYASRRTDVYLGDNSRLEYMPKETIAFANSRWYQCTAFHVTDNSKLFYSDIFCPGRIARDEFWDFDIFASKMIIEKNGKIALIDNAVYRKEDKQAVDIIMGGYKFLLNTYWYSKNAVTAKKLVEFKSVYGGSTEMPYEDGIVIKALSNSLDDLKNFQLGLWRLFRKTETGTEVPELRIY